VNFRPIDLHAESYPADPFDMNTSTSRLTVIGLLAAAVVVLLVGRTLRAEPTAAAPADFASDIVLVLIADAPDVAYLLERPATTTLGDITYLVGDVVDPGDGVEWRAGRRVWVPVDTIGELVEFPTVDTYRDMLHQLSQAE
jgi:hypothetical protein